MRKKGAEMPASLGRRRRPRPDSPAATPPLEDDDLIDQIFLRLPPLPSSLPRASLVSERWRRLVSDPGFVRRFRLRHRRNPPILGFFYPGFRDPHFVPTLEAPDRVPPDRFSLQFDDDRFRLVNCRHGLVLVNRDSWSQVLVWDPVTTDQHRISLPPGFAGHAAIHGAVVRSAGDAQHFQVVLVMAGAAVDEPQQRRAIACVYSSETGKWGDIISAPLPPRAPTSDHPVMVYPAKAPVLVKNSLYWMLVGDLVGILEFDLDRKSIAVIEAPVDVFKYQFNVVPAEGGALGFLSLPESDRSLQLWKRKIDCDGVASWVVERTIELDKLLPLSSEKKAHIFLVGFAEYNNVVLLWTFGGVFMIHLKSLKFKKIPNPDIISVYHPFESVYASETCIGGGRGGAELLLNNSTG